MSVSLIFVYGCSAGKLRKRSSTSVAALVSRNDDAWLNFVVSLVIRLNVKSRLSCANHSAGRSAENTGGRIAVEIAFICCWVLSAAAAAAVTISSGVGSGIVRFLLVKIVEH